MEVSAGIDHRTSDRFLDTVSAGAGIRFGALLGENFRLIGSVSRESEYRAENKDVDHSDDRYTRFRLNAAWDLGEAHQVSLGYYFSRYKSVPFQVSPFQDFVSESESANLGYTYFVDWGQAGITLAEVLGFEFGASAAVNAEYKLPGLGGETEFFALASAGSALNGDGEGFSAGLRAKMPNNYNLYFNADRNFFSSGGNSTIFSLSLVKSFGANAGRIFRRH